jgi:hypothetical protein
MRGKMAENTKKNYFSMLRFNGKSTEKKRE